MANLIGKCKHCGHCFEMRWTDRGQVRCPMCFKMNGELGAFNRHKKMIRERDEQVRDKWTAVQTRSGRKTHLGLGTGSTSMCGCWPVQKVSDNLKLIDCEKCIENNPGPLRKYREMEGGE